ncbi:lysophosphatidic acid receptor 2 isoform X3 [Mustela erminea]|uniref:lysophosphatidic acid receptor 2 isoform X3 n=1 Tax=Mustela erminea TaxID=36723 RepID=UPI001387505F|nr:lysophosphatidic acid receptor 2 isoform X3 [Mustela erminea]
MATMSRCYYNETIGFFYNNSGKELSSHWRPKDVVVVALGLTVSVLVLLTNLLVIAAIASNRRFHQPIYYLLGNLAAADLFAGVAYLFLMFHTGPRTARLSLEGWFVRQGLLDTSLTASVATLLAIAVERHRSVMAVQLHSRLPRGRVVLLIVGVWVAALGLGLLPAHSWHCLCALDRCSRMAPLLSRSYLAVWALSSLLVFLLMVAVYTRIFFYVRRRVQRMAEHVSCHPRYRETTLSLVKTVVIILGKSSRQREQKVRALQDRASASKEERRPVWLERSRREGQHRLEGHRSIRGLLDTRPGGAAPGWSGLQVLQRSGCGEVFPTLGGGQLTGQRCGVLVPRR